MLDGTFYVSDNWPDSIVVWAGYFRIKFVPQKAAWRGREKIAKIVGDFIDLKGLAITRYRQICKELSISDW